MNDLHVGLVLNLVLSMKSITLGPVGRHRIDLLPMERWLTPSLSQCVVQLLAHPTHDEIPAVACERRYPSLLNVCHSKCILEVQKG